MYIHGGYLTCRFDRMNNVIYFGPKAPHHTPAGRLIQRRISSSGIPRFADPVGTGNVAIIVLMKPPKLKSRIAEPYNLGSLYTSKYAYSYIPGV